MNSKSREWKQTLELLQELSEAFGVSGFEEEVRECILSRVAPLADEVHVDPMGNLHAVLNPQESFTLMLDAHMDEVGFVVRNIEEDGFLRLAPIGGWDVRSLPGQRILIRGAGRQRCLGVVGTIPPHVQEDKERKHALDWKDLFVDVGASSPKDLSKTKIRVGSPALIPQPFIFLESRTAMGKALDNRAGCAVLIQVFEALSKKRPDGVRLVGTFSTTEEVGCRGASVAARSWKPQMALILEGTLATDTPGIRPDQRVSSLGQGPVLTAVDRSLIVPESLLEQIISLAEEQRIAWQMKTPLIGSTDGGVIQRSAQGVLTAIISVPCRYIHSPGCLIRLDDIMHTKRLVESVVRKAAGLYRKTSGVDI
jgi:putative aminopeptidase FrvX